MVTEIVKMVDGQIEHIRIWIPRETLVNAIYLGQAWADSDIEYVRTHTNEGLPVVTVHYCNNCGSREVVTQHSNQIVDNTAAGIHQRAERAALKICEEFGLVEKYTLQAVAEMIVAEFDGGSDQ